MAGSEPIRLSDMTSSSSSKSEAMALRENSYRTLLHNIAAYHSRSLPLGMFLVR